jgi:hypothetical protein
MVKIIETVIGMFIDLALSKMTKEIDLRIFNFIVEPIQTVPPFMVSNL